MKSQLTKITTTSLLAAALLAVALPTPAGAGKGNQGNPGVLPPQSHAHGKTYAEWSVAWWQWGLSLPQAGNPLISNPFDVTEGQSGHVWFLATPGGVANCTIPAGTTLFVQSLNSEWSSLEGFPTEAEQRAEAEFYAAHMVDLYFIVDGQPLSNLGAYLIESPQFSFTAPSPWVFGNTGGTGTAVAEGYCFMLAPLSVGQHTLQYGGRFHFSVAEGDPFDFDYQLDMVYNLTVTP